MGGAFGALGGGINGYIENGWEGVWGGALQGARLGAIAGGATGFAHGLVAPFICFTAGTPVLAADGPRKIETLRVGRRVLTEATKDAAGQPGDSLTAVDPATWRLVRLQTAKPAGSDNLVDVELLRPLDWIGESRAVAGSRIHFELAELGLSGPACVLAIEPCPEIEPGRGRVITGTFTTARCSVLQLRLSNGEVLEPTPPHRFRSLDRGDYVPAENLRSSERLTTRSEEAVTVDSIALKAGQDRVYNLEVEQEHQFYVGETGVLVHNAYPTQRQRSQAESEAPFGSAKLGNKMHERFLAELTEKTGTAPEHWEMKTGLGQRGVDATYVGPKELYPGFKYAELKPATASGYEKFLRQIDNWELPKGKTQLWGYNEAGNIFSTGRNF